MELDVHERMFAYVSSSVAPRCSTEGERWAREELERLRFTPAGVGRFLRRRGGAAREIRRARPELARRARSWMAVGGVLYVAAPVRLRPALAWWAA